MFKIVTADERLSERRRVKGVIFGPSGVGKTSLLRTLKEPALFVDLEGGDLSVADWQGDSVRIKTFDEMLALACLIGGPDETATENEFFSPAHFASVQRKLGEREEVLGKYQTIFIDSITVLSRLALKWAEKHPDNLTSSGKLDMRGAYGMMGKVMMRLLTHIQHTRDKNIFFVGILDEVTDDFKRVSHVAQMEGQKVGREIAGIVDVVITMHYLTDEEKNVHRVLFTQPNPQGYPAKDRSGKLDPIEKPDLQNILNKIEGAKA